MSAREGSSPGAPAFDEALTRLLDGFVSESRTRLGEDLVSAVLFGSAAEGALRSESDVNLILVLRAFPESGIAALRGELRLAQAAARLEVMFILEGEVEEAAEAFAVKFADIGRRRRVLFGTDPFAGLTVPEDALRRRLSQSLLNLTLRLREAWAVHGGQDDEAARSAANFAGPLRASAASILSLEGAPVPSPKEALRRVAATLPGGNWSSLVESLSAVRERRPLAPGEASRILGRLPALASLLRERARRAP